MCVFCCFLVNCLALLTVTLLSSSPAVVVEQVVAGCVTSNGMLMLLLMMILQLNYNNYNNTRIGNNKRTVSIYKLIMLIFR